MCPSQQRKLLRTIVKLFGKRSISGAEDQGLDLAFESPLPRPPPFSSEEKGWLETTIAPRVEHLPQGLKTANYFNSAGALGEEKEETLCIAKHLKHFLPRYGQLDNSRKWDIIPMLKFSYPPYTGNFAVEISGTVVRERFRNDRKMKLAFLVLTSHA